MRKAHLVSLGGLYEIWQLILFQLCFLVFSIRFLNFEIMIQKRRGLQDYLRHKITD